METRQDGGNPGRGVGKEADFFTLEFNAADTMVAGRTNCNRFFGKYELKGKELELKNLGMTRMACPDMQYEDAFVKMLDEVDRFEIKGAELTLFDDHKSAGRVQGRRKRACEAVIPPTRNICGSPRRGCRFFCIRRNETTVWWRTASGMDAGK